MKNNLSEMTSLDMSLATIQKNEEVKPSKGKAMPLLSWDIFRQYDSLTQEKFQLKNDIEEVKILAKKSNWKNEFETIFNDNNFEAIVITDLNKNIVWINDGFAAMTGYSKEETINKTPNFLQGKNTSDKSRKNFRRQLNKLEPFTEVITNYRKDNSAYKCEVKIFPLYNKEVTHFLAIEREVI
ncbi:PAS domain-containing protein [Cellulophaga baltica]|uniref:PAS domain-containing protein n=1 Tax=Cellulophaga TaxID=104264 RepID=UPI001C07BDCE|nr:MULTISPECIES: PAS domain-containing protein [Cellulophaga]MBU2997792.1 PAS domain-containing protein [Cellulophaga baltica]MDO6769188.1 PAS domain-containing protein [Cellulophaga sp. 1_MG-2023]